jgi:hypothetical protein
MNRTVGRVGGLVVSVVAAAPFVYLWVVSMRGADDPLTFRALPLGVLGAAAGSAPGRRRRTGEHAERAPPA